MHDASSHIHGAYIEPLKSVLLIDDRFPRYEELLRGDARPNDDPALAGQVIAFLRHRNLMCDVENRSQEVTDQTMDQLTNSDLLVLDYHLTPGSAEDPSEALRILAHLSDSPRANLVVVYTSLTTLEAVRRQVACYLRGLRVKDPEPYEDVLLDWEFQPTEQLVDYYLQNNTEWRRGPAESYRKELSERAVPAQHQTDVLARHLETFLSTNMLVSDRVRHDVQLSDHGAEHHWVHCGNVFVAFASKNDADILNKLERALVAWQPPALQVILAHARNKLDSGGFEMQKAILGSPDTHVAWLYHALAGEEPSQEKRLEQLFGRLVMSLGQKLAVELAEVGQAVLPETTLGAPQQDLMKRARDLARDNRALDQEAILHSLNSFLCGESYEGSHLKTGTVFRSRRAGAEGAWDWWVCVEPACDMMPRPTKQKGSWKADLEPLFPMEALRLAVEPSPRGPLATATHCKHIFLNVEGVEVTLRVNDGNTNQPRPEMLLVRDWAKTRNKKFKAHRVQTMYLDDYKEPVYKEIECEAVAQLRTAYSDRLLHEAGFHGARVGVDFVDSASQHAANAARR